LWWGERGGDLAVAKGVCCGGEKVVGFWAAMCSPGWWMWEWRAWRGGEGYNPGKLRVNS